MSQKVDLEKLKQHRNELLLAEVAAWLHMLGKFHEDFLDGNYGLATQIPPEIPDNFKQLNQLLTNNWTGQIWAQLGITQLQANNLSIASLITSHQNPNAPTGFERLMWDAHGRGSGSEKGALERFFAPQKGNVYLSTAFGHEPQAVSVAQNEREDFYRWLEGQLADLQKQQGNVDWGQFRPAFVEKVRRLFSATVAETRRPINDVTLFDQTFASVAVFKAALAQNVLTGWKEPRQNNQAKKYHWRILRLGIDGLRFWGNAPKLTDVLGRKAALETALDAVQRLLEEEYPLGAEVYRDENGSLFIVPDIPDLLEAQADGGSLQDRLQAIAKTTLENEALFALTLNERTRNMLSFGQLASAELPPPSAYPETLRSIWKSQEETTDICPVCGVRPQGYAAIGQPLDQKALDRNVCGICERRRVDRSADWAKHLETTVWTNEVADENGRLALLVGRFGLEAWLSGEAFSSVMAFEPAKRMLENDKRSHKKYEFDYSQFLEEIAKALPFTGQPDNSTPLLNNLLLSHQRVGSKFSDTYDFYVSDTDLQGNQREAWRFALALMRQQPSPARLRRIWETTQRFWQTALDEKDEQGNSLLAPAGKRLEIVPKDRNALDLGSFHAYELVVEQARISVIWDSNHRRFIVCENQAYFAQPERLGKPLREYFQPGNSFMLEEPAGYGAKNKEWGEITIEQVNELPEEYLPIIPILAEPRTFMAIVPANRALNIVKAIQAKYQRELGKVRNHLPLYLGVVYFGRRTPLFAALDAARAMLDSCHSTVKSEPWKLASNPQPSADGRILTLAFENGIVWQVPVTMDDRQTKDLWYPYFALENPPAVPRTRQFTHDSKTWVHVQDLQQGDVVSIIPSRFDFLWLDTSERRFEAAYGKDGRRSVRPTRPFYLEDLQRLEGVWKTFSQLSRTQIKQLLETIENAHEHWFGADKARKSATDETFKRFIADTLANAEWPKGKAWKDISETERTNLTVAAVRGELADLAELHLEILKEKTEEKE